jgi:hypothetical protein
MNTHQVLIFSAALFFQSLVVFGRDGAGGMSGAPISFNADGTEQSFRSNGGRGGDGSDGRDGWNAHCLSTGGPGNVHQPSGDSGEPGGDGGNGGWGGNVTAYFDDIANLKKVFIQAVPGGGGYGGRGGRGGNGCRCSQHSWTITGADGKSDTYYCTDGSDGYDGRQGSNGSSGGYGRILLVKSLEALKPAMPSIYIDMAKMETAPVVLSQNIWEKHTGARGLFKPGSTLGDGYSLYTGRTEVEYTFQWKASRPVTDFAGWHMLVQLVDGKVKVTYPNNLQVDSEVVDNGNNKYTFVIHSALSTNEVANLQLGSLSGFGPELKFSLKDNAKVSDVVGTSIHMKYQTVENGSYKVRLDAVVPASAISVTPGELTIAMGQLGLDEKYLAPNLQIYIGLTVTRTFEGKAWKLNLGNYYKIKEFGVGSVVEAKLDTNLYSGTQVVGTVKKGEKFKVTKIQDPWAALVRLDGAAVKGWIKMSEITISTP